MAQRYADDDLKGKLVLVTGGGSGIGRSCCQLLASAGANLAIADVNLESALETRDSLDGAGKHLAVHVDVSLSDSVKKAASEIQEHFGTVPYGVIHSAGIVILDLERQSSLQCKESDWDKVMRVNLKGTFLVNTTFAQLMRDGQLPAGSIVNITSLAREGYPPFIDYCASKAGVAGITKTLALELAPFNIRVNAVAPANVLTPMMSSAPDHVIEETKRSNPMRRIAMPEEVAQVCLFLLRSSTSSYVTGQIIGVDGGETKLVRRQD